MANLRSLLERRNHELDSLEQSVSTIQEKQTRIQLRSNKMTMSIVTLRQFFLNNFNEIKKQTVTKSNINEYTRNKIDSDIDKVNKVIARLEDWIFHYQDALLDKKDELVEQKELLNKLNNLKRFN
jgi:prefoldin subunit 5